MKYATTGKLTVLARSNVHDTTTVWDKLSGEVDVDPDAPEGAKATFRVDMRSFDCGDWLKNRKLRGDLELEAHPTATFDLVSVSEVKRDGSTFTAKAIGTLHWRGQQLALEIDGRADLDRSHLAAKGSFELDIRRLGMQAPRFLMFKMSDVVTVNVQLAGAPT